ncbi:MAG: SPOR domain-containing protein [Candidatus Omnitrophica bacterium]|nr:SPOR domain-containing protein [Candidatus Omnitrophota bacterium]
MIKRILVLTFTLNFYLFTFNFSLGHARATIESLAEVEKLFIEERYERVVSEADRLIDARAYGREELFYLKGLSQIKLTAFRPARETFEYMIDRYPRGKRAFDGYIGIGDSYFIEGRYSEALKSYNDAIAKYPESKNMPAAYYKIALSYQRLGQGSKAKEYFDMVKDRAPLSFESKMMPDHIDVEKDIQPRESPKSVDTTDYYYVQAGYFKDKNNAERLTGKLREKGYDANISIVTKGGNTFYRIKVGSFKLKSEAEVMTRKLKADGYKTKVCR